MPRPVSLVAVLLAAFASACSLIELAGGQLQLINEQRPLPEAIARERSPERRALLREVPSILAFAEDEVGLHPGRSYTGYFETERPGLTYVLTACARDAFEPVTWWFPIVGRVEYRSYWDEADARSVARELEARGFDTWLSPSRAYSSLGLLRDPVTTTMLRDGLPGLTEVLIHELTHAKLYVPGHTDWDEALASFVGERGAERYFEGQRFARSGLRERIERRALRKRLWDAAVSAAYAELEQLYAAQLSRAQKLQRRERVFAALSQRMAALFPDEPAEQLRINNARLLHLHRYSANSAQLQGMWDRSGHEFRHFWALVEAYAAREL